MDVLMIAKEIGVEPKQIHIREMKRKWASCSTSGRLTFAANLLNEPKDVRIKAIIHELLHLRYPNHGRMFSRLLNVYVNKVY